MTIPVVSINPRKPVGAVIGGVAVTAAGVSLALLLPDDLLDLGVDRLSIALLGVSFGALIWCLSRMRKAIGMAYQDTNVSVAEVRNAHQVKQLLAQLPDAIVAVDQSGIICVANASAARLLGVLPDHVGSRFTEALATQSLRAVMAPVLAGTSDSGFGDLIDLAPDSVIHVRVNRVQADGDGWLVLICATDATRLRHLERLRHDFVANVSHELRTPITAIMGFVETMLDRHLYRDSDGKRFLHIASAHAERLHALVEDLVSLSRIEQGEHNGIDTTVQPLAPIVTRSIEACQSLFNKRNVRVEVSQADSVRVRANAPLLERALVNLIENAFLYGGDAVSVGVSVQIKQGLLIIVADDGPGIPVDHLDRIFERFYRIERDSRIPGSGLGLAIVKHIVQAHGGCVSVSSEVGSGTTFTVQIPL